MTTAAASDSSVPTVTELLQRARAMHPVLLGRCAQARELRRVPDQTIAEFKSAGFFKMMQPARMAAMK